MYDLKFTKAAAKELQKIPKPARLRILDSLELLRVNPFAEIIKFKKLRTNQSLYRVRVGDYRVIYEVHGSELLIIVVRVGHRRDVYRYLVG